MNIAIGQINRSIESLDRKYIVNLLDPLATVTEERLSEAKEFKYESRLELILYFGNSQFHKPWIMICLQSD